MPQIAEYRVTYMSTSNQPWKAEIRCNGALNAPPYSEIAFIRFYEDAIPMPPDSWVDGVPNGVPNLNFPLSRLPDVLSILRDEDYVSVDGEFSYDSGGSSGVTVQAWGLGTGPRMLGEMRPK